MEEHTTGMAKDVICQTSPAYNPSESYYLETKCGSPIQIRCIFFLSFSFFLNEDEADVVQLKSFFVFVIS